MLAGETEMQSAMADLDRCVIAAAGLMKTAFHIQDRPQPALDSG